jgi:ABC-type transporter Mla subunit MlaD
VNRRRNNSIAANPILIGGVTVLVTIVAVFLSYNANHGLPFVPTYKVDVIVPNADGLIAGNEVRIGGDRVGIVKQISGFARRDGSTGARMELAIDANSDHLPVDSTIHIRPKSALGLKYIAINRGKATRTIPQDGTLDTPRLPVRPVDIDDWFNMFDEPTRAGSAENLLEYGTAFAGRGGDLNSTFRQLNPTLKHAGPALETLNAPATQFQQLFPAFAQAAAEVGPVAEIQARLFGAGAQTFAAFADNAQALQQAIAGGPRALETATRELPAQAEFVNQSTELFRRLKAPLKSLAHASTRLAPAFADGIPALDQSPKLNARLVETLHAVDRFVDDPRVLPALARITRTGNLLDPLTSFVVPAQTECNYLTLLLRNIGSSVSESDAVGTMLRASPVLNPQLPDSEVGPSATPANGPANTEDLQTHKGSNFLHSNPYPNTASPGQTHECEAGNEGYVGVNNQLIGNVPGDQGMLVDKTSRPEVVK